MKPKKILKILKEGNERFVKNLSLNRDLLKEAKDTSESQSPIAVVLSCLDSRSSAEVIFDQGIGDVFSARVAGNVINDDILGSMEFACYLSTAKVIVVLNHFCVKSSLMFKKLSIKSINSASVGTSPVSKYDFNKVLICCDIILNIKN